MFSRLLLLNGGMFYSQFSEASQVALPLLRAFLPQFVKILPGVQAAVMAIVEDQANRVVSDRFDLGDDDILFADLQRLLSRAVAANLGGRRIHAQVLERQFESRAVVEGHFEQSRLRAELE